MVQTTSPATRSMIGALGVATALTLALASPACAAQSNWQTSWKAFVSAVGPKLNMNPVNPAFKDFAGKTVAWEGTLGSITDEKRRIRIEMDPNETHGFRMSVQLFPKSGEFARWKALAIGAKVKFKAVIEDQPIIAVSVGGVPLAPVFVRDGELAN